MNEIKQWISETGFTNIGWAAGFVAALAFGFKIAAGVCLGIFLTHNYVVIKDLIKNIKK